MVDRMSANENAIPKENVSVYTMDSGEKLRLASFAGGYRHKKLRDRRIMLELGNPAILLLLLYLMVLPGIVIEFLLMKELWYFGFELYSMYVFVLSAGCVAMGFYLIFRSSDDTKFRLEISSPIYLAAAIALALISLILLLIMGPQSGEIAILLSIFFVFSAMLAFRSTSNIAESDAFAIDLYGMGIVLIAFIPVHHAFAIWSRGAGTMDLSLLDFALIILGVSISLFSINSVKTRMGLLACWLFGAMIVALVAFHEIAYISNNSVFEIYDQSLAVIGAIFSVIPVVIYFQRERRSARIWSHLMNATDNLNEKDYEKALSEAEKAIRLLSGVGLTDRFSLPWSLFGDIYFRTGQFNKAKICYDMAISIDPKDFETLSNLGSMLAFNGYSEEALIAYQKAADLAPDDPKIWNNLGIVFLSLKMYEEALTAFKKAIYEDDSFALAHYNAGMILMRTGRPAGAFNHFKKLMQLVPDDENSRMAYERSLFLRRCFQQITGWRIMKLDVTELLQTILYNPRKFVEKYSLFVGRIVRNYSSVFDNNKQRISSALKNVNNRIKSSGQNIKTLISESGLSLDQLRFCIAILIISNKVEFRNINNEIWLIPILRKAEKKGEAFESSYRLDNESGGFPTTM